MTKLHRYTTIRGGLPVCIEGMMILDGYPPVPIPGEGRAVACPGSGPYVEDVIVRFLRSSHQIRSDLYEDDLPRLESELIEEYERCRED